MTRIALAIMGILVGLGVLPAGADRPAVQSRPGVQERPAVTIRPAVTARPSVDATTTTCSYYIDNAHPSAADANPGTEALPWLTLYEINNRTFVAGDTICVKTGIYVVTTGGGAYAAAISPGQAGASGNPITVRNYPDHSPVIDGQDVAGRFKIGCSVSHCTIRGFSLVNTMDHGMVCGTGQGPSRTVGCTLERNTCEDITEVTANNPECYKTLWTDGAILQDNFADNSMNVNVGQNVCGIANEHGINVTYQYNEIYGFSCGFFDKYGGNGNVVRFNYVHSVDRGIFATCFGQETNPCGTGNWHHNIVAFSSNECVSTAATTTSTEMNDYLVERNPLHSCAQHGIRVDSAVPSAVITNNYVQSAAGARGHVIFGETGTVNYNAYNDSRLRWIEDEDATPTTYTTMAGWQATGRDANGVVITGTPFTGTPSAGERDPTVYRPSAGGGLQNAGEGGTHIGAYDTDTAVVGIRP